MNLEGLDVNWDRLFRLSKIYLEDDMAENMKFLRDQVGQDLPERIRTELQEQSKRIAGMPDE